MLRSFIIIAAAAAALSGVANAGGYRFSYNAWELQSAEGRAAVLDRIEWTARTTCRTEMYQSPQMTAAANRCASSVAKSLVGQIGDQRLAEQAGEGRYAAN
ncbi:MAG: UrcA family protein [Parvularculaceae bacterium]|nr:UrcA family protein [Parvularculaceae bacterium]